MPLSEGSSPLKCSSMARVVEGFHSFTCTATCVSTNQMNLTCLCLPCRSWSSFTDPGWMEGWVGLGITTVSKQSAQDHYMTGIAVLAVQTAMPQWATGAQGLSASNSQPLRLWAVKLTTEPPSHTTHLPWDKRHPRVHQFDVSPDDTWKLVVLHAEAAPVVGSPSEAQTVYYGVRGVIKRIRGVDTSPVASVYCKVRLVKYVVLLLHDVGVLQQ